MSKRTLIIVGSLLAGVAVLSFVLLRFGHVTITATPRLVRASLVMTAIESNTSTEELAALLDANPGLVSKHDENRNTLLHHAVDHGRADLATLLLDRGADPNAFGLLGVTPLVSAIMFEQEDMVRLLLARGADPTLKVALLGSPAVVAGSGESEAIRIMIETAAERKRRKGSSASQ